MSTLFSNFFHIFLPVRFVCSRPGYLSSGRFTAVLSVTVLTLAPAYKQIEALLYFLLKKYEFFP